MTTARIVIDVVGEEVHHVGFSEVARRSGYNRGQLYHIFGDGASRRNHNPSLSLVCDVAEAVGMELQVVRR